MIAGIETNINDHYYSLFLLNCGLYNSSKCRFCVWMYQVDNDFSVPQSVCSTVHVCVGEACEGGPAHPSGSGWP